MAVLKPIYKIHPAIGIARLGDAGSFFIGPEKPGFRPEGEAPGTAVPPYKDGGKIKPQAARFRIFEYVDNGKGLYTAKREISLTETDVTKLQWTAHLANRKASFFVFDGMAGEDRPPTKGHRNAGFKGDRRKLEIDPRPRTIGGKNAKPVEFSKGTSTNPASERWPDPPPAPEIKSLGRLLTDDHGRLIVIGGQGFSTSWPGAAKISNYANNDGWFDDVSDGPVTAYLELNGKAVTVVPAWVLCGPPDFAPHLTNIVTLYDLLYDMAARELTLPANEETYVSGTLSGLGRINAEFKAAGKAKLSKYQPNFASEIYPLLYRAAAMRFLAKQVVGHHDTLIRWNALSSNDPYNLADRQGVAMFVRVPGEAPPKAFPNMPKLLGDEPYQAANSHVRLSITPTQYALLKRWESGDFYGAPPAPPSGPPPWVTPEGLDRAALENCVGGAFFPGIEAGWLIRRASIFAEPFRIKHGAPSSYLGDSTAVSAGYFTRQMALPWQADFLECKTESDSTGAFPGEWGWWPGQRPDWVFPTDADYKAQTPTPWPRATKAGKKVAWPSGNADLPDYDEMLANWRKFGFIVETTKNMFLEREREADIP